MAKDHAFGTGAGDGPIAIRQAALREPGDVAGSVATTAQVTVGDTFSGGIYPAAPGTPPDADWVRVELVAGQTYVFTAYGIGGAAGLRDPMLTVRDGGGRQVAFNDDAEPGAGNLMSMVRFTPSTSGIYYLDVRGVGGHTGHYTLRTATDVFTIEQGASQLTDMGWGLSGSALRLAGVTAGSALTVNLSALSPEGRELARMALETWSAYTGISFVETGNAGATISFRDRDPQAGPGLYAYAGPVNIAFDGSYATGQVTISTGWLGTFGTTYGSYSYLTYLHEIGHALGLGHGGFYDGNAAYGRDNHYLNDSYQMSIMSYFGIDENSYVTGTSYLPITPMPADILAMQMLYGVSPVVFAGDTVWGAQSSIPGRLGVAMSVMFDGAARPGWMIGGQAFGFTIMDSGGVDTMNFSRTSAAQLIDMRQGGISNVYGQVGTVVVALGTVIENAVGGTGADTIYGNDADNFFMPLAGNDVIYAGAGNDVVWSSFGNDFVDAGDGNDEVWGAQGFDTLYGGNASDTLGGGIGNDMLYGGAGPDQVWGGVGDDEVNGGTGADVLAGGVGRDTLDGGAGNDIIYSAPDNDQAYGGAGDDFIWGGPGNDLIFGGDGNDTIAAGLDNDTVSGGAGADTFVFYRDPAVTRITDFSPADGDRLDLTRVLWESRFGTLTPQQIESRFASLDGNGNTVLSFGDAGTTIVLVGFTDINVLDQHISIF
ncbi:M10 family metallopeptidase C-terminal domain-containing protein [Pseudotabrizicola sp. 4114]|uniref:M10 family metallopeptidase C-terminal domain-containing protein n=1 Tax=Pseudotabrizicola sp. 4114 TaxID=2817731 RepID=UPI002860C9E8|nr:serralysin [Pseudorhodobacter sp. 4114]